ncbi:hypothetical protein C8F01DRAFT_1233528 [Mycena amicta]|nr:hypothetical protein C8F01DRAFT_1233528 [Mycena amicta]
MANSNVHKSLTTEKFYLVTGGAGFIGSAVVKRLHDEGHRIRVVGTVARPSTGYFTEYIKGDLRDSACCKAIMQDVGTVLHFAANMGGMGVIHTNNDFDIYRDNSTMTLNVLEAAVGAGVERFLYASSACVYPDHLPNVRDDKDIQLSETDVFSCGNPSPQGLYGLEKLVGEMLLQRYANKLAMRIARLHNIYGPGDRWNDGREKVPAALARKAVAAKRLQDASGFEIWGDGSQRRSFLYIDDCVDGLLRLLRSSYTGPVNIGSDQSVSILELAELALGAAGLAPFSKLFAFDTDKPVGVQSRNSDNRLVKEVLDWEPRTTLKQGIERTVSWIDAQVEKLIGTQDDPRSFLRGLQKSAVIQLNGNVLQFGVLLPITSRGPQSPDDCLKHLRRFAASLYSTTWRDVRSGFHLKIYLAIDDDDDFLSEGEKAETVLRDEGIWDITRLVCSFPHGHVCSPWRECATAAWKDGCDYMALFGDDVELLDEGWLRGIHKVFQDLSRDSNCPPGFGCVAFTDISFPGMPTFPVIHRTHMDIFDGNVIPSALVSQDGDPFLFQLYHQFGSSQMASFRLRTAVGGSADARYTKQHLQEWTYNVLNTATTAVEFWLDSQAKSGVKKKCKWNEGNLNGYSLSDGNGFIDSRGQ